MSKNNIGIFHKINAIVTIIFWEIKLIRINGINDLIDEYNVAPVDSQKERSIRAKLLDEMTTFIDYIEMYKFAKKDLPNLAFDLMVDLIKNASNADRLSYIVMLSNKVRANNIEQQKSIMQLILAAPLEKNRKFDKLLLVLNAISESSEMRFHIIDNLNYSVETFMDASVAHDVIMSNSKIKRFNLLYKKMQNNLVDFAHNVDDFCTALLLTDEIDITEKILIKIYKLCSNVKSQDACRIKYGQKVNDAVIREVIKFAKIKHILRKLVENGRINGYLKQAVVRCVISKDMSYSDAVFVTEYTGKSQMIPATQCLMLFKNSSSFTEYENTLAFLTSNWDSAHPSKTMKNLRICIIMIMARISAGSTGQEIKTLKHASDYSLYIYAKVLSIMLDRHCLAIAK